MNASEETIEKKIEKAVVSKIKEYVMEQLMEAKMEQLETYSALQRQYKAGQCFGYVDILEYIEDLLEGEEG